MDRTKDDVLRIQYSTSQMWERERYRGLAALHVDYSKVPLPFVMRRATPWYWTSRLFTTAEAAGAALPEDTVLWPEFIPSPSGIFWLSDYVTAPGMTAFGGHDRVDGFLWWVQTRYHDDSTKAMYAVDGIGSSIILAGLTALPGPFAQKGIAPSRQYVFPASLLTIPYGESMEQIQAVFHRSLPDDVVAVFRWYFRTFLSMLLLLQQKVVAAKEERGSRAIRKRLFGSDPEQEKSLRVIYLRDEIDAQTDPTSGSAMSWRSRWVVRGHWRRQYYPSRKSHIPLWIVPYVKGPKGLPVNHAEKLYVVSR